MDDVISSKSPCLRVLVSVTTTLFNSSNCPLTNTHQVLGLHDYGIIVLLIETKKRVHEVEILDWMKLLTRQLLNEHH
jgi:hypothetical protein